MKNIIFFSLLSTFFVNQLQAQTHMYIAPLGKVNFVENGNTNIAGNLINNGTINHSVNSSLIFKGNSQQTYRSATPIEIKNLTMDNVNGLKMDGEFIIKGVYYPIAGHITHDPAATYTTAVLFDTNATIGATPTDASHIACPVVKRGNSPFNFPIGDGTHYKPLRMSAPQNAGTVFWAEYHFVNPTDSGFSIYQHDASINNVSAREFWRFERVNGSDSVQVGLDFFDGDYTNFGATCDLVVAHWNGTQWENKGNGNSSSPTITEGFLYAGNQTTTCGNPILINSFSPFTLASTSASTVLPTTWLSFNVTLENTNNLVQWSTASERNNDHFNVLKSLDGIHWVKIAEKPGAGTTTSQNDYETIDLDIQNEISYYQIEQVDFDGNTSKTDIQTVKRLNEGVTLYPNPVKSEFMISSSNQKVTQLTLTDISGKDVLAKEINQFNSTINIENLPNGVYLYTIILENNLSIKGKIIKN